MTSYETLVISAEPSRSKQLELAWKYNDALSVGALLEANSNIPTGDGTSADSARDYNTILTANNDGLMGRIKMASVDIDLPIYHGTADATLLKGVGHLEGTSLPIGGESTRTVLTVHRGLADAKMFTDLDKVTVGERFTAEIFGEVLTYEVIDKRVVEPDQTESLRVEAGKDLATLVTCTPLGINTHRILLTGERVTPTPIEDIKEAGQASSLPRFPWWIVWLTVSILLVGVYIWWAGWLAARNAVRKVEVAGVVKAAQKEGDPFRHP